MTVYYAPGGGLGHVTRAHRVLDALGIRDAIVIASADLPPALEGDVDAHRSWLLGRVDDHLIVDTFPAGIQGELAGIEVPYVDHVARLLRLDEYRGAVPADGPRFRTTYAVEELTAEHEAYLRERSESFTTLALTRPSATLSRAAGEGTRLTSSREPSPAQAGEGARRADEGRTHWLIVHSGPAEEVRELIAYAMDLAASVWVPPTRRHTAAESAAAAPNLEVLVATRCDVDLPPGFTRVDALPATHLYATAQKIITAAGFNVMLETEPYRERHHAIPFPRRFDDQFLRAARRRNATARIG